MPPDTAYTVCPHDCPSTCALDVERLAPDRIGAVHGAADHPYTAGIVCTKVANYAARVHHPGRLRQPLRRTGPKGSGEFSPIGWDDALDEVAETFIRAAARHGGEAVWPYAFAGTMGLVQRDGIERLRHVMRYSGQDKTICSRLIESGWRAGIGAKLGPDVTEYADSDLVVLWGCNPVHSQINLMQHVARARKGRGAKLVVVDPYRTPTAATADIHLALRPGTDGALACAVMHVLLRDGHADRDYMARLTDVPDGLEAHLAARSPEWAAGITGLETAEIENFAALYGTTKRSMIRVGYGFSRTRNGAPSVHAVTCLPAMTGAWAARGGGATYSSAGSFRLDMRLITGADIRDPSVRILDMTRIGAVLTGDSGDLHGGPPVTAMLIQNTNPVAVAPESGLVRAGFGRADLFVCVHEQFMTETAEQADIVLPATTFLEHDDLYVGLAHAHLQIGPRAIDPLGEARSNHDVLCGLAQRLGASHPGFDMSAWEIIDRTLRDSGYGSADDLAARRWIDCQPDFESSHFLRGFPNSSGKFRFSPDWASIGTRGAALPPLPDHVAITDESDEVHPFRLVTAPSRMFLNTSFTETPDGRRREVRPTAKLHPDDCAALGLEDGELVRLGNRRGSVVVHAAVFDGLQRGVAVVEGVWPSAAFEEGIGINLLTGSDAPPPAGGGAFHDTAVWVRPVSSGSSPL